MTINRKQIGAKAGGFKHSEIKEVEPSGPEILRAALTSEWRPMADVCKGLNQHRKKAAAKALVDSGLAEIETRKPTGNDPAGHSLDVGFKKRPQVWIRSLERNDA